MEVYVSEARGPRRAEREVYFSEELIDVNLVLSCPPIPFTDAIMTSAMPVARSAYSIAVAPDSSAKNLRRVFMRAIVSLRT
jgi:hypothetical protein